MQKNEIVEAINTKTIEAKRLINEINYLKKLLNSDNKQIENNLTKEEKVNIFMNYFKGRDNVYPYISIDKKDPNKKYYIPKCANEWNKNVCNKTMGKKCRSCQYWVNKPLDKEVIRNHLFNNIPIGMIRKIKIILKKMYLLLPTFVTNIIFPLELKEVDQDMVFTYGYFLMKK